MRVLGIVPARSGSKGIPRKNQSLLGGKTLVEWAMDAATESKRLAAIVLSSDSDEILSLAREPVIPLKRPAALATSEAKAVEYVRHALANLPKSQGRFDAVAIIQPTSPFTRPEDIDGTIECLLEQDAPSAVSVCAVPHAFHPVKIKRLRQGFVEDIVFEGLQPRSKEELEPYYMRNGSVYVTRTSVLERGSLLGERCAAYVMPGERSIDINDAIDLKIAQALLEVAAT